MSPQQIQALLARGQAQEALAACGEALAANRLAPGIRYLAAHALLALRRFPEALALTKDAIAVEPAAFQTQLGLGSAALAAGAMAVALFVYEHVLAHQPQTAKAHAGRAMALVAGGRAAESIDNLARAVELDPAGATAVYLQASYLMMQLGFTDSALVSFTRLLELRPGERAAQQGRVISLVAMNRYEDALPELAALQSVSPPIDYLAGVYLHAKLHCWDWADFDKSTRELTERVRRGERADAPLTFIVHNESPADQLMCARTYVADKCSADAPPVPRTERPKSNQLRIGYLSSDFRDHAVAQLLVGVLESHDRERFETFAFSTGPNDDKELRQRVMRSFDHFVEVTGWSDLDIASLMARHSIDIAVDLGGHSDGGRTRALAYRPAPVQIGFLGYPGTSGTSYIDYLVADRQVIPEAGRSHYSEQIIYLPDTYMPSTVPAVVAATATRIEAGLPEQGFVYCCFNGPHKISPVMFDIWARVLAAVPDSVLWLRNASDRAKKNLSREIESRGVDASRLVYAPRTETRAEHFARLALADVFLDTRPYNAHTTAIDTLGVGVPIITMKGNTFASRVAYSLLHACGLDHLAVETPQEYESLAISLAQNPHTVSELKAHLARARDSAPLFDPTRFCRNLEAAFTEAWARHLRGEPPSTLWVG